MKKKNPLTILFFTLTALFFLNSSFPAFAQSKDEDPDSTSSDISTGSSNATPGDRLQRPTLEQHFNWLAEMENTQQVQWLEGEKRFFTLHTTERTGQPKGAVILIPSEGQYAGWSQILANLHNYLPDYGWYSLAISLPERLQQSTASTQISQKTNANMESDEETADDQAPENESEPSTTPTSAAQSTGIDDAITSRLQASLKFLNEQNQFNIILIGHRSGAVHTARFAKENRSSVQAIVLIDASNNAANKEESLPELLSNLSIPILDVYHGDNRELSIQAAHRKQGLKKLPSARYQLLDMPPSTHAGKPQNDHTVRRIRGWLGRYVSGNEMTIDK